MRVAADPLLTFLGRRGRAAVARVLAQRPGTAWSVRGLARAARVPPAVASRAVAELQALGAVDAVRPGRAARVQWRPASVAARFLGSLEVPDLRRATAAAFAAAYDGPHGTRVVHWQDPEDDPGDPRAPTRLAVVHRAEHDEEALDAVGPALDAVRAAGLPAPEATPMERGMLAGEDPVAVAVRSGQVVA